MDVMDDMDGAAEQARRMRAAEQARPPVRRRLRRRKPRHIL
jgi:hypothetical protein